MKRFLFPKSKKLKTNEQFKTVLSNNVRASDELLTLYVAENQLDYSRLGVSVSKTWGPAVTRNKLKRLVREAFRQTQNDIPAGFDYLVMFSTTQAKSKGSEITEVTKKAEFEQIKASFLSLAAKTAGKVQ